jgi:two-component system response regulator LytT
MKVLIVEDVTLVAERISDLAQKHLPNCKVQITYTLTSAKAAMLDNEYDLLFLDLNVNGENGFELLKLAVAASFKTIVITATPDKAAQAFDYGVLDFVTKPIMQRRFKLAVERFLSDDFTQREQLKYLSIKTKGMVNLLPLQDIDFIQASGNYAQIHTTDESCYLHDKSCDKLLKTLPSKFIRIHRSYIVPQNKISKVIKHGAGKYSIEMSNGRQIPLSREVFKQKFADAD